MHKTFNILAIVALLSLLTGGLTGTAAPATSWQDRVDPWVLETAAQGETEFLVFLAEQADLSAAAGLETKLEKGAYVYQTLAETAARTQGPILAALASLGVEYQPYWVANMIWARGGLDAVEAMARRPDVAHIYANPSVKFAEPIELGGPGPESPDAIEWNISWVNADDLWDLGITGQDVVIAGQDTGYRWDHAALINQYRGWDGASADHNYNWHDSIHSGGGSCGPDSPFPCDDHGHGTHTMGTMVGDDGGSNQIGMAPGAKWIGCRNMNVGVGTPATYSECFQWFIAPTDLNNQNPDPSKAPHVINNSWGCPPSEGCTDPNVLLTVVENTRAAGILVSVSAGNSGSSCSSVDDPPAIYEPSFTVGATGYLTDNIAGFSSRGPVTVDGSNRLKPNISAPGVNIRSSTRDGGYQGGWQGTSMASPHVAGLVGLLISARPILAGQVDLIEYIIEQSALHISNLTCGGDPSGVPNNTYGWGRIDALAAYNLLNLPSALEIEKTVSAAQIEPGGILTYTLTVTHTQGVTLTNNLVLTDVLPADTTFITATAPFTFDGTTVTWLNPSLDVFESWSVEMAVQVADDASGTITNADYGVRSDEVVTVPGEPVETAVVPFEVAVAKSASPFVSPGSPLTYTLTVDNLHPFAAIHNLVLTDVVPADTTLITATLPYTVSGSTVRWDAPALAAASSWTVELVVQVAISATGTITNADYGVLGDEFAYVGGTPVATLITERGVSLTPDLSASTVPSSTVVYTHTLSNTGNLTDTYDLSHVSSQGWEVTYASPITLGSGKSTMVTVTVTVPETATPGVIDELTLTATSQAEPAVNDSVTDTTTVQSVEQVRLIFLPFTILGP